MTALIDFTAAGELEVFIDEEQVASLERKMNERGYLEGSEMANTFNMLRANDLIWSFVVNNYLMGKDPFPFDLLYWNSDSTRMPAANHAYYLRQCYWENSLTKGRMVIANVKLDLADVNLSAEYRFSKRLSVFLELNNLLDNRWYRWYNYQERPFDIKGGVTFSF